MFENIMAGIIGFLAVSFALIMLYIAIDPKFEKSPDKT